MHVTRQEIAPCTVKLLIQCDQEQVRDGYAKAYRALAKQVKLPGFRPGHAPRQVIEQVVSSSDINDEAAEAIVRHVFKQVVEGEKLTPEPTVRPTVELVRLDQDKSECEFNVTVSLPPIVELGDPKGLPIEVPSADVSEAEIDRYVEDIRARKSTREAVTDRAAEDGDIAVLNIKPDDEDGDGRTFMVVVGQTFPQLDGQVRAMQVEEIKRAELEFPKSFQEKDWAGAKKACRITLNSISSQKLPELDDAFAKELKVENVSELKEKVAQVIREAKERAVRDMLGERLLDQLLARSRVQAPEAMWEALASRRLREVEEEQRKNQVSMEQYAAERGMTLEQLGADWRAEARTHVLRALVIRDLFAKENMKLTNEDFSTELGAMADEYGISVDELVAALKKNDMVSEVEFRAISRKATGYLLEHAEKKEVAMTP